MGFWNKVKGVFSRIGSGIKNAAVKTYDWLTNNKEKIKNVAEDINNKFAGNNKEKFADYINKGSNYADKAQNLLGSGLNIISKF